MHLTHDLQKGNSDVLLSLQNIHTEFKVSKTMAARAVNGVSIDIGKGEILGIVGESGSGKTVLTHSFTRVVPKHTTTIKGKAIFNGADLLTMSEKELRSIRGNSISMIFQDPSSSLNPYMTIGTQMIETLRLHKKVSSANALIKAIELLDQVGIQNASEMINRFPYQFSGGMRQRVMIAMALLTNPELLIADEPTTALDVTVQAQILRLLTKLQKQYNMSILFITHNLAVVSQFCHRVAVMYGGRIMESAPVDKIFSHTSHPYTHALIKSIPSMISSDQKLSAIPGLPPDPLQPVQGCPFAQRCAFVERVCIDTPPEPGETEVHHFCSCIRFRKGELRFD